MPSGVDPGGPEEPDCDPQPRARKGRRIVAGWTRILDRLITNHAGLAKAPVRALRRWVESLGVSALSATRGPRPALAAALAEPDGEPVCPHEGGRVPDTPISR
jgi:hypothetical protein